MNEITFACQNSERKTVLELAGHPTVLERLWLELDTTMDSLMNIAGVPMAGTSAQESVEVLRIRARAQADTLAILMSPFFNNADEIAREAKLRWESRQKGEERITPGIAGEEYVPPAPKISATPTPKKKMTKPTGKRIPESALVTVKQAIETKMFTVEQIAKTYGMTSEEVRLQLGLA
jgi:hypothetical protein